jgi:hypothetical protein
MESPAMKKDSSILNFILGVILMLLLAFAAKAQDKNNVPKSNTKQFTKKKKQLSADEAKVLYEEKYGKQNTDKRKAYSRKDIEEKIPRETEEIKTEKVLAENKTIPAPKEEITISKQTPGKPKAIYKGPANKQPEKDTPLKPVEIKSRQPVFLEHIEITISNN